MTPTLSPAVRSWTQIALFRTLLLSHARFVDRVKAILDDTCGLSMMEFDMIAELGGSTGMNMGDLSRKMITSPSSVTRVAKALEKKGLVSRHRSEHSEREVIAALTPKGQAFFDKHFREVAGRISRMVDERLEPGAQQALVEQLEALI